jgi:hypothetical protein
VEFRKIVIFLSDIPNMCYASLVNSSASNGGPVGSTFTATAVWFRANIRLVIPATAGIRTWPRPRSVPLDSRVRGNGAFQNWSDDGKRHRNALKSLNTAAKWHIWPMSPPPLPRPSAAGLSGQKWWALQGSNL